jgi:hypothetical protein
MTKVTTCIFKELRSPNVFTVLTEHLFNFDGVNFLPESSDFVVET